MSLDPRSRRELRKMALIHGGGLVLLVIVSFGYVWWRLG